MKIYNSCPTKISNNFVIKDTEMIKNHSMFLKIPPNKTSLYQKYIDEWNKMYHWVMENDTDRILSQNPPSSIQKHIDDIKFYKIRQLEICRKFNEDAEFISNVF